MDIIDYLIYYNNNFTSDCRKFYWKRSWKAICRKLFNLSHQNFCAKNALTQKIKTFPRKFSKEKSLKKISTIVYNFLIFFYFHCQFSRFWRRTRPFVDDGPSNIQSHLIVSVRYCCCIIRVCKKFCQNIHFYRCHPLKNHPNANRHLLVRTKTKLMMLHMKINYFKFM